MNLSKKPLAMAYVPWQTFENVMEGECALRHGTIFEDLVFPFVGAQAACQADRSQNHSHSGSCGCHNRHWERPCANSEMYSIFRIRTPRDVAVSLFSKLWRDF